MTPVNIRTEPIAEADLSKTGGWIATFFIFGNEMAEHMAYYGLSVNMVIFMFKVMHRPFASSANAVNNFLGISQGHDRLFLDHVLEVYHFDRAMPLIGMRYIKPPHIILCKGLITGVEYPLLAEHMSDYMAKMLFFTSLLCNSTTNNKKGGLLREHRL